MKGIILLELLTTKGRSNTETLIEFLCSYLEEQKIEFEIITLSGKHLVP